MIKVGILYFGGGGLWPFKFFKGLKWLLLSREFMDSSKKDELKLKFAMPQSEQIHEIPELDRASYSLGSIFRHLVWNQKPHLPSQKIPGWFDLQGRAQSPQGYLKTGPGFISIPERTRRLDRRSACLGEFEIELLMAVAWIKVLF